MGEFDAPAQIDYLRHITNLDKVAYIGHSQGTAQMFYAIPAFQDYWKERLNLYVALAPITRLDHCGSKIMKDLAKHHTALVDALDVVHVYDIFGTVSSIATDIACGIMPSFCKFAEGFLITSDPTLDDTDRFQVYMGHFPATASIQSLVHFAQILNEKQMKLFDYGKKKN